MKYAILLALIGLAAAQYGVDQYDPAAYSKLDGLGLGNVGFEPDGRMFHTP